MYYLTDRKTRETVYTNTIDEVIEYLSEYCKNVLGKTRQDFMNSAVELCNGIYDDRDGRVFTEYMSRFVEMGVVKETPVGRRLKECNIHEYERHLKYVDEFGDF